MRCHYEILGLESNCTADDLKKAYRKLALEWHPDKNLHRLDEAKENFQLIQQAYEILTDPQERAWYDRHKDDILRGGAEQAYKDDCLDVYQYFNTSCFKGYNDSEKGFYTVYRQVFEKITAEDKPFMDDEDDIEVPQFGYSHSSYEEVVHNFYAYWQSYCTAKSFSWVDKFDLSEARRSGAGRPVIRAMEKENKKFRDQHKKMRNEEVRELVAFVRKRDKRIQAHKKRMEEVRAEKAKKAEELRKKQLQERKKAFEDYKETEWSSMSQFENHFNEIESTLDETFGNNTDDSNENDELDELGDLYCIACEKDFRSQKAFKNHENSKKHKENVAIIKELMEEEEEAMANSETVEKSTISETEIISPDCEKDDGVSSEALLDELIKSSTKSKKKKKKNKNTVTTAMDVELAEVELKMENTHIDEENSVEGQGSATSGVDQNEGSLISNEHDISSKVTQSDDSSNAQQCLTTEENKESKLNETNDGSAKLASKSDYVKKKGKKDKACIPEKSLSETNENTAEKPITLCGTCNNNFSSRNKLFEHLKQTGHAVYKNGAEDAKVSGKKQRKKKL